MRGSRERNRLHARKSRLRKKAVVTGMSEDVHVRDAEYAHFSTVFEREFSLTYADYLAQRGLFSEVARTEADFNRRMEEQDSETFRELLESGPPAHQGQRIPISDQHRVQRSRDRNRIHAKRSRERRKLMTMHLRLRAEALAADIAAMRAVRSQFTSAYRVLG